MGRGLRLAAARAGLTGVLAAAIASPALGQTSNSEAIAKFTAELGRNSYAAFSGCDGYGEPTMTGDGMTTYAYAFGLFIGSGDRRQGELSFGDRGVAACNVALAKMESRPKYWMRKVSLLRARAMHRLAWRDTKAALADLDAADAAAMEASDPYYQRSLKLGIDLIRAMSLRWSGDQAGASALAGKVFQARPYSRHLCFAVLTAMGPEADFAAREPVLRRLAQLDPGATSLLYVELFEARKYAEVVELFAGLKPMEKPAREPMQVRERLMHEQDNRANAEVFWAEAGGLRAYALAALGRPAEARAALAEARARLEAATPPAKPLPDKPSTAQMAEKAVHEQANLKIRTEATPLLAQWTRMTEARLLVGDRKLEEAMAVIDPEKNKWTPSSATIDFLEALSAQLPAAERPDLTPMRESLRKALHNPDATELRDLIAALPEAETPKRLPLYRKAGVDGYSDKPLPERGLTSVVFEGDSATAASMQEAALLRAVELAELAGKDAILLESSKTIERTIVNTYYSTPVSTVPQGYEARLEVAFVDSKAPDLRAPSWRLISTAAARAALAPFYPSERPRPPADKD